MFGFMRPSEESPDYRAVYARCCQHLRRHYGLLTLLFHSYEAVVAYACALDAEFFPASVVPPRTCCGLGTLRGCSHPEEAAVGRFCASMAVMLADVKLCDDIRDEGRWSAKIVHRLLRRRIARASKYFHESADGLMARLSQRIEEHLAFERPRAVATLEEYVVPTAEAFSVLFAALPETLGRPRFREPFAAIGRHLGAALLSFDCAVDWERDRVTGNYNPVSDDTGEGQAFQATLSHLEAMQAVCASTFGRASRSAEIVASVARGVAGEAKARHPSTAERLSGTADSFPADECGVPGELPSGRPRSVTLYSDCGPGAGLCVVLICLAMLAQTVCKKPKKERTFRDRVCSPTPEENRRLKCSICLSRACCR
jgi:hypothetical protein